MIDADISVTLRRLEAKGPDLFWRDARSGDRLPYPEAHCFSNRPNGMGFHSLCGELGRPSRGVSPEWGSSPPKLCEACCDLFKARLRAEQRPLDVIRSALRSRPGTTRVIFKSGAVHKYVLTKEELGELKRLFAGDGGVLEFGDWGGIRVLEIASYAVIAGFPEAPHE